MALLTQGTSVGVKTEGTSQTFGQLVIMASKGEVSTIKNPAASQIATPNTIAPVDTLVKIIPNDGQSGVGSTTALSDTDRSKISISAFSTNKEPTVAISRDLFLGENTLQNSQLFNVARVAQNSVDYALVVGSVHKNKEEIRKILTEAQKVDLMITLKSRESEALELITLKELDPEIKFVYNFFIPEEADLQSQEDPALDPLLGANIYNVPRYVHLKWSPVAVTDYLSDIDESVYSRDISNLKRESFQKNRGLVHATTSVAKNSFLKSKKRLNLFDMNGVKVEVNDMHNLDIALNATSNKKVFSNSISAVVNIDKNPNVVPSLPLFLKNG